MNTTPQTPQSLETEVDAQLAVAAGKTTEIARVQAAIDSMVVELAELDSRILIADENAAKLELDARLSGSKPPKASGEADTLHGAHRRLSSAIAQAKTLQAALAAERAEAFATATQLSKSIAGLEYSEKSREVAAAWNNFHTVFEDFSAAALHAGVPAGWNGHANFSPYEGMRVEAIEGARVKLPDHDQGKFNDAIGRSNAGRVQAKIDAVRLP
jgi:hypothetical protein